METILSCYNFLNNLHISGNSYLWLKNINPGCHGYVHAEAYFINLLKNYLFLVYNVAYQKY